MTTKFHAEKSLLDIERDINYLFRTAERVEKPSERIGWMQTLHKTINRLEHLYSYVQQKAEEEDEPEEHPLRIVFEETEQMSKN